MAQMRPSEGAVEVMSRAIRDKRVMLSYFRMAGQFMVWDFCCAIDLTSAEYIDCLDLLSWAWNKLQSSMLPVSRNKMMNPAMLPAMIPAILRSRKYRVLILFFRICS